jgi:hypothetical protein
MMTFNAAAFAMIAALAVFPTAEAGKPRRLSKKGSKKGSKKSSFPSESPSLSPTLDPCKTDLSVTAFTNYSTLRATIDDFVADRALWRVSMECGSDSMNCGAIYG